MNKSAKIFINFYLPVIVWAFVIFNFSSQTTIQTSVVYWQDFVIKKLAHITEYAVFSILLYRAFTNSGLSKAKAFGLAVAICFLYAVSDELHQSFTPKREPTLRDVGFDTIGSIIGGFTVWILLPKTPKVLKDLGKKLDLL
ncbi:MAG: VanZ family protein [Patescibacteria group bacterium]